MDAIQKLISDIMRKVQCNEKVTELEWVLDIAYKDTGIDKGTLNKAAQELAAKAAEIAALREALEPFVMAYNENGGCVPITDDDREEMLYSIFNVISLDDFSHAARALKGAKE